MSRTRTRSSIETGRQVHNYRGRVYNKSMVSLSETTTDVVSEHDNQFFRSETITRSGGLIDGSSGSSRFGYRWYGYPCVFQRTNAIATNHLSVTTPSDSILASEVLKRTNPSRASIDAIVSLLELREIPGLIRDSLDAALGRMFKSVPPGVFRKLKKAAKINLMIQFGVLPLISDIQKSLQFQSLVDGRVRELKRLQERGLRRTIDLGTYFSSAVYPAYYMQTSGVRMRRDVTKETKVKIKGHVRWNVSSNFYSSDSDVRALAQSIIANKSFDPYAIYELTPWSWLLDYFSNLGDYISLSRNLVGATHHPVRIMKHTTTRTTTESWSNSRISISGINNKSDLKTRLAVTGGLDFAQLDFLNKSQWSILGSLAVLKGL